MTSTAPALTAPAAPLTESSELARQASIDQRIAAQRAAFAAGTRGGLWPETEPDTELVDDPAADRIGWRDR